MCEFKKMSKKETLEILTECLPGIMFCNDGLLPRYMMLGAWHYTQGVNGFDAEYEKLTELLGPCDFKGMEIPEQEIEFFTVQAVWGFYYGEKENAVVLYLSDEGLSLELADSAEPYLGEIYDCLICKIVDKEKLPPGLPGLAG